MNLFKTTIATAAVITCCMGNHMPAKAAPYWVDPTARDHCEYLSLGVPRSEAVKMALNDNRHWRQEMLSSYSISKEATTKAYAQALLRICPDVMEKLDYEDIKAKRAAEQQKAQQEFNEFYRSTKHWR